MKRGNQNSIFQETPIVRWGMTIILIIMITFGILSSKFEYPLRISAKVRTQSANATLSATEIYSVRNGSAVLVYNVARACGGLLFLPVSREKHFKRRDLFSISIGNQTLDAEIENTSVDTLLNVLVCDIRMRCDTTTIVPSGEHLSAFVIRDGLRPMENIFKY